MTSVFYEGTSGTWEKISIDETNAALTSATRYYFSETEPVGEGNFWRYVDGKPTAW